jgi:hypothetical protein
MNLIIKIAMTSNESKQLQNNEFVANISLPSGVLIFVMPNPVHSLDKVKHLRNLAPHQILLLFCFTKVIGLNMSHDFPILRNNYDIRCPAITVFHGKIN